MDRRTKAIRAINAAQDSGLLTAGEVAEMYRDVAAATTIMKVEKLAAKYCARVQTRAGRKER
jgi:hypothetical protein